MFSAVTVTMFCHTILHLVWHSSWIPVSQCIYLRCFAQFQIPPLQKSMGLRAYAHSVILLDHRKKYEVLYVLVKAAFEYARLIY